MSPFASVFERRFDAIIIGGGFVGLGAARALTEQGWKVLLVESSGSLLWEATGALENSTRESSDGESSDGEAHDNEAQRAWNAWLAPLTQRGGTNDEWFDVALAEVLTAHQLQTDENLKVLLYATPVGVELIEGKLSRLQLATKGGYRSVSARYWLDASESGILTRLCGEQVPPRAPRTRWRSVVTHSLHSEAIDQVFPVLAQSFPGLECYQGMREGERRLRWPNRGMEWQHTAVHLVRELRALLEGLGDHETADLCVSHYAMQEYPVYESTPQPNSSSLSQAQNVFIASPALVGDALTLPSERYALGWHAAKHLEKGLDSIPLPTELELTSLAPMPHPRPACELTGYDVVVAGTGTAGAIAALTSARGGARTLAFDAAPYPGGIGTGGAINGYYRGVAGGIQDDIDCLSRQMTQLLSGAPATLSWWHHDAKKLVLLDLFEQASVAFRGGVFLCGVERDENGRVQALHAIVDEQLVRIPATTFIDSTGDGDLCALAGARFETGRRGDGRMLAYSQSVYFLETHATRISLRACNFDAGWVDATDPEDLSAARLAGTAQHLSDDWTAPARPIAIAPLLGLRESRHISTDRQVGLSDMIAHTTFEDAIGEVKSVADTHSVDFEFESDELAFYYWVCRCFFQTIRCELPYRMLLPQGLSNVLIACRAAGIEPDAGYGLRMQREMQRLGEAAGIAAALTVETGKDTRHISVDALRATLAQNGPLQTTPLKSEVPPTAELLAALDAGEPGMHLWHLYQDPTQAREEVAQRLGSDNPRASFFAATLLAMWEDERAEARLIKALVNREEGPTPDEYPAKGAFSQCIALPFWLQAVVLLRRVGTPRCLRALHDLAAQPNLLFNVRTMTACTLERLAIRLGAHPELVAALESIAPPEVSDSFLPPTRSIWRMLHNEPQKVLYNDRGVVNHQDHRWQLDLILARTRQYLGLEPQAELLEHRHDERGFVRRAFTALQ